MRVLPAGAWIGRFRVLRVLGKGSMGVVYLATDPRIGRPIALKTFRPEGGPPEFSRDEMEDQFLREARLAGRLQHPNIVTVFDDGRASDVPFIVMEYVDGESLKALLAARAVFTVPESLWILRQIAEGVGHAHEKSVLHRDIKPGNVLLRREGAVKVTDFGLARSLALSVPLSLPFLCAVWIQRAVCSACPPPQAATTDAVGTSASGCCPCSVSVHCSSRG